MKRALVHLRSAGPYQQSRHYEAETKPKEGHDDFEVRTWRERCHYLSDGTIYIPAVQFKNALCEAGPYLGEKIKGGGQATWSKHFRSGVRVINNLLLPEKKDEVSCLVQFGNAQGKRNAPGGKVKKYFPLINSWEGEVEFIVLDDKITESVFRKHLEAAGTFIGVGKERPSNGGDCGRFLVVDMVWEENYLP